MVYDTMNINDHTSNITHNTLRSELRKSSCVKEEVMN